MTNYEKIKSMSIEEMAVAFDENSCCGFCAYKKICAKSSALFIDLKKCQERIKEWLESEVIEND